MLIFYFTLRHLRRHWPLNTVVLLCLTLASALLAALPGYAAVVAARELDQNLAQASSAQRSLLITGDRYTFRAGLFEIFQEKLGDVLRERLIIRHVTLVTDPPPATEPPDYAHPLISYLNVYSFEKWPDCVRVVQGRLPTQVRMQEAEPHRPPPIEVAIGARVAQQAGLGIGDRLTAHKEYYRLDIVGLIEPLDPHADLWGGDLSAFSIGADTSSVPLIIAPTSMRSNFRMVPLFPHEVFWRITLDRQRINADRAPTLRSDLVNVQTQLSTRRAEINTGLLQILGDYVERLSQVRTTLLLLATQALIFVLYALTMLTSFMLERSQAEIATLVGRGASAWQITRVFALEYLALAAPAALLLGPGLAQGALRLWAGASLPSQSWLLSGIAAGLSWLALVLPVFPAARSNILDWQRARARPQRLSEVQKRYLDLFLLVLGGLLYWQLRESGSFVTQLRGGKQVTDPLLLLGPSLLLVASATLFLRLFPFLLRLCAWGLQRLRGLLLPLGLQRLARAPLKPSRVVLLISLTTGLLLFTHTFANSLSHSQEEMAHYLAGADLRVSLAPGDPPIEQLRALPGVLAVSPVFSGSVQTWEGQTVQLLALDPATFAQAARYPARLGAVQISSIVESLQPESEASVLPAVFSSALLLDDKQVGEQMVLNFAGRRLSVRVQGSSDDFPGLSTPFVLLSLPALQARVDLDAAGISGSREAWLAVDPAQHQELAQQLQDRLLDDAQARLGALQLDALAQGTSGALRLNTLTLALFSVATFALFHFLAAQQRVLEFGVLRALGLSVRQLLALLLTEGALALGLGLAAGTMIGYGLSRVMIPYLSQALAASLSGVAIEQILVDWSSIAQLYALLIAFYGLTLVLLLLILLRVGVHQAMRMGDE